MRNRRKNNNQMYVKPELLSEAGISAEPTGYLEDASLFRIHHAGHIFQTDLKRGPYSIHKYIHKLVKNLLFRYRIYIYLSTTQRYTVTLGANEAGRRRREKITKRKNSHHFFRNVEDLDTEKLFVRGSPMHVELKNLILTLRSLQITSPLNSLIIAWVTNSFFPLQISNTGALFC